MNEYIEQRQIVLSSTHADKYINETKLSAMIFNFTGLLMEDETIVSRFVSVLSASLPYSHYIINEYNNKLVYNTGGENITVYFDYGMYQALNFINEFQSKVPGFTLSINKLTGKYTITHSSNFTLKKSSTIFYILGFDNAFDYESSNNTLTAPHPCDFSGLRAFKIKSNILRTLNRDSYSNNYTNDIALINNTASPYGITIYNNVNNIKSLLQTKTIDYIDIEITDQDDNYINFNNREWTINICLELHKKRPENMNTERLIPALISLFSKSQIKPIEDKNEEINEENTNNQENFEPDENSNLEEYLYLTQK